MLADNVTNMQSKCAVLSASGSRGIGQIFCRRSATAGHLRAAHTATCLLSFAFIHTRRRTSWRGAAVRATDDDRFDETAASVRRLLKRDRKDLQASSGTWQPEWDDTSSEEPAPAPRTSAGASTSAPAIDGSPEPQPKSPLGSPSGSLGAGGPGKSQIQTRNPFSDSGGSKNPFDDPKDLWRGVEPMETDERKWWQKITFGQVALGLSFLLVIGLMFATFAVTVRLGGVSFNE